MNQKSILFQLLTAEESDVITGGGTPEFIPYSDGSQGGNIISADGGDKTVSISTKGQKTTNNSTNGIDILQLALPLPVQTNNNLSTTTSSY